MVVVFMFHQTPSALSPDYYGPTSMVWTLYISSAAMVAQGVLTPSKNQQNCTEPLKKPQQNVDTRPVPDDHNLRRVRNVFWSPVGDLGRVATDALCCCFASNCSLFICGVFTEEPWQRQFSVTCRETSIKTLLLLILIIPTRNIWNKTAM